MRGLVLAAVFLAAAPHAKAVEPFGMQFGMSRQQLVQAAATLGTVSQPPGWATVFVKDMNLPKHEYLFNFCEDKLIEANEIRPFDFHGLARTVDESIHLYNQPSLISVTNLRGGSSIISWFWWTDSSTLMRVEELADYYRVGYAIKNDCRPVRLPPHG